MLDHSRYAIRYLITQVVFCLDCPMSMTTCKYTGWPPFYCFCKHMSSYLNAADKSLKRQEQMIVCTVPHQTADQRSHSPCAKNTLLKCQFTHSLYSTVFHPETIMHVYTHTHTLSHTNTHGQKIVLHKIKMTSIKLISQ